MLGVYVYKKLGGLLLNRQNAFIEIINYLSTIVHVVLEEEWLFYYTLR